MPRTARASVGGMVYHVLNRGNERRKVFRAAGDYRAFLDLLGAAGERTPMRILGFCLMPNHFHLLLRPRKDGDLSRFMQWLLTSHVRRYRAFHGGSGHVWQGRFKAFPVQADGHYLVVLRYVERNPLRAGLVDRAQDWAWGSLAMRNAQDAATGKTLDGPADGATRPLLADSPVELPADWTARVNRPQTPKEEEAVRASVRRGAPYGDAAWQRRVASELGLESSLRPRGRPRKGAAAKAAKE